MALLLPGLLLTPLSGGIHPWPRHERIYLHVADGLAVSRP
jgi:hypothetical protein